MELTAKTCVPCQGGTAPLSDKQARQLQEHVPEWELIDNARKISRTFRFDNFKKAMQFAVQVGNLAEKEGHHPDITFGWAYCTVLFYTHKINGLHENDFIMAAKIDVLYASHGL